MNAYEKIVSDNFTVGQTEELVREILYKTKTVGVRLSREELEQAKGAASFFGGTVTLKVIQTRIKGKIVIETKGSLQETTSILKSILAKLTS